MINADSHCLTDRRGCVGRQNGFGVGECHHGQQFNQRGNKHHGHHQRQTPGALQGVEAAIGLQLGLVGGGGGRRVGGELGEVGGVARVRTVGRAGVGEVLVRRRRTVCVCGDRET